MQLEIPGCHDRLQDAEMHTIKILQPAVSLTFF